MVSPPRGLVRAMLALVLALLVIGGVPVSAAADAEADSASDRVVAWLAAQPVSGLSLEQRLDLALAYQAGGAPPTLIEPLVNDVEFLLDRGLQVVTRTLAKAIVVLDIAGRALVLAGGKRDLVAELQATVGKAPSAPGEFEAAAGDGLVTQAWGILAELRAGLRPRAEVRFLLSQQCPGGWFVPAPTVQSCERRADIVDQALVLTALVSASRVGLPTPGASLLSWLLRQLSAPRSDAPVSALAWLSWPLGVLGHGDATDRIQDRVRALQLMPGQARDRSQVGAIGGETRALLQDLLTQRLDPPPAVSAAGPDEAKPGARARFLVQGLTSGERVSLAIAGVTGTSAAATAGADGTAVVHFEARSLAGSRQRLEFTTTSGASVTSTLSVLRPLVTVADSSGVRPTAAAPEQFELTLWQAIVAASLLLLVLVGGSFLLRDRG